jgi:hypothetical protein
MNSLNEEETKEEEETAESSTRQILMTYPSRTSR